jgi:hypothetical protein
MNIAAANTQPGTGHRARQPMAARARDTQSFTKRTGTKSEIQIVFIPARSLSFL